MRWNKKWLFLHHADAKQTKPKIVSNKIKEKARKQSRKFPNETVIIQLQFWCSASDASHNNTDRRAHNSHQKMFRLSRQKTQKNCTIIHIWSDAEAEEAEQIKSRRKTQCKLKTKAMKNYCFSTWLPYRHCLLLHSILACLCVCTREVHHQRMQWMIAVCMMRTVQSEDNIEKNMYKNTWESHIIFLCGCNCSLPSTLIVRSVQYMTKKYVKRKKN